MAARIASQNPSQPINFYIGDNITHTNTGAAASRPFVPVSRQNVRLSPYSAESNVTAESYIAQLELYFKLQQVIEPLWAETLIYHVTSQHLKNAMLRVSKSRATRSAPRASRSPSTAT